MIVREAQQDEFLIIVSFQEKMALETENLKLSRETLKKGVKALFSNPSRGKYYVVEDTDGTIAASLLTTFEWSDWRNSTVLWIQSVYVLPEYRKSGIFSKMYEYIKDIMNSNPEYSGIRLYVDKTNTNAQKVYNRVGMNGEHYQLFEEMKDF